MVKEWAKEIFSLYNTPMLCKNKNQESAIISHRLLEILKNDGENDKVSEFEVLQFLSDASLIIPLKSKWYRIYCYLFNKFHPEQDFIPERDTILNENEHEELLRLRRDLFKKLRNLMK